MLTSSSNLRLSSQPSFSSPRSTDLQNNLGPSAQNKEQVNMIRHSWMCCCLYISWATQQLSQKAYSSVTSCPLSMAGSSSLACYEKLKAAAVFLNMPKYKLQWNSTYFIRGSSLLSHISPPKFMPAKDAVNRHCNSNRSEDYSTETVWTQ